MVELNFCGREKREKPREKPTQNPFRQPRNPHGVTETRTRDLSSGSRASNRLGHGVALNPICPICRLTSVLDWIIALSSWIPSLLYVAWFDKETLGIFNTGDGVGRKTLFSSSTVCVRSKWACYVVFPWPKESLMWGATIKTSTLVHTILS